MEITTKLKKLSEKIITLKEQIETEELLKQRLYYLLLIY